MRSTTARKTGDPKAEMAFRIRVGQQLEALTGVVITRKPGSVRMLKTVQLDNEVTVPEGTLLYTLHQGGEGSYLYWFEGKARWGELYADSVHKASADLPWDVLSVPVTEWWLKVRTQAGPMGWVLNPTDFKGMDSCGR